MKILEGGPVAHKILEGIREGLLGNSQRPPCVAFVLIGHHPPSESYVKMKAKACEKVGILSRVIRLEENVSSLIFKDLILSLNQDETVDGILIQMPIPKELASFALLVDPKKDVDGFSFENMGKLLVGNFSGYIPCTPHGIYQLLNYYQISLDKKHVVIVGRSNIVGKPLAALIVQKIQGGNATVTLAHAGTPNLKSLTKQADIVVFAIGQPHFFEASYIKEGAIVIDVGINRVQGKIVGDGQSESLATKAQAMTPVPGGVGPMTIACLLLNTYLSYKSKFNTCGSSKLIFDEHLLIGI